MARLRDRAEELWAPRRSGCAIVLELLNERDPRLRQAANVWEAKVLRIVGQLGLPQPAVNHRVRVGGRVAISTWRGRKSKVAVEFDGFVPHSTRRVFDDDRARQNDLVADGWTVFRVTTTMLDADPSAHLRVRSRPLLPAKGSDVFQHVKQIATGLERGAVR